MYVVVECKEMGMWLEVERKSIENELYVSKMGMCVEKVYNVQ